MFARVAPAISLLLAAAVAGGFAQDRSQPAHEHHGVPLRTNASPTLAPVAVEGQPLAANISRVIEALEYLGAPLPPELRAELGKAGQARDARRLQELLDARVLVVVHINPEARVKVARGPAAALQE